MYTVQFCAILFWIDLDVTLLRGGVKNSYQKLFL